MRRLAPGLALAAALVITAPIRPASAQVFDWLGKIEIDAQGLDSSDAKTREAAVQKLIQYQIEWTRPYLLKALADPNLDVRGAAGRILGKARVREALPVVVRWLTSPDKRAKQLAAEILGELGFKEALAPLVRSLGDVDHEVRLRAVGALGKIGGRDVVVPLISRLEDDKAVVRAAAVHELMQIGDPRAVIPLVGAFADASLDVRVAAVTAVGRLGNRAAVPALLRLLRDPSDKIRVAAVTSLGSLRASEASAELIAQLETGSTQLRAKVAYALGQIAEAEATRPADRKRAIRALVKRLDDGQLKAAAREALLHAGKAAVPALIAHLEGRLEGDPTAAVMLLRDIGDPRGTPALIAELDRGRISRELVLDALSKSGDARALVPVLDLLSDDDATVRLHAMRALEPMLTPGSMAADVLVDLLGDANLEIQVLAAEYLGVIQAKVAIKPLSALAEASGKGRLRAAAVAALGEIGDPQVIPVLLQLLDKGPTSLHMPVTNALITIGNASAVDRLLELAASRSSATRAAAVRALGGVLRDRDHPQARDLLEKLASRDRLDISLAAIAAIGAMAAPASEDILVDLASGANVARKRAALVALGNLGTAGARATIMGQLASADDRVGAAAACALVKIKRGQVKQIGPLLRATRQRGFATPVCASAAIAVHATTRDSRQLSALLHHRSRLVRANAAFGVGRLALTGARSALLSLLTDDSSWLVRVAAARALSRVGGAGKALERAAESDADERVQKAAKAAAKRKFEAPPRNQWTSFYFVDPTSGDTPVREEPYFLVGADGLVTALYTDARGEASEEQFPAGDYVIESALREREY